MAKKEKPKQKGENKKRYIRPVSLNYKTNVTANQNMNRKGLENFSEYVRLLINNDKTK